MSFSGFPGMPEAPQQKTKEEENRELQQMQREAERNAWVTRAFNQAYFEKHKDWQPENWVSITDPRVRHPIALDKDENSDEAIDAPSMYIGNSGPVRIFPPGDYHYGDPDTVEKGKEFIIHFGKDGYVYPIPRRAFAEKGFEASVDFLVGTQNAKAIELHLPCGNEMSGGVPLPDWREKYNLQQLNKMILIAQDRGVAVSFSASTENFIQSLPEKEQLKIRKAAEVSQVRKEEASVMLGQDSKVEFGALAGSYAEKQGKDIFRNVDVAADDAGQKVKDALYGAHDGGAAAVTTDEKLERVDQQIKQMQERSHELKHTTDKLLGSMNAQTTMLKDPLALVTTTERGMTLWNQLKDSLNKSSFGQFVGLNLDTDVYLKNRQAKFTSPTDVVQEIKTRNQDCEVIRAKLIERLDKELGHLEKSAGLLRKELAAIKAGPPVPSDAEKAKIEERLKKIEVEKKGLEEKKVAIAEVKAVKDQMPGVINAAESKAKNQQANLPSNRPGT